MIRQWIYEHTGGILVGVMLILLLIVAWCTYSLLVLANAEGECVALGYTEGSTWGSGSYCYIRIGGTDYVIPLAEARPWMETTGKELRDAIRH